MAAVCASQRIPLVLVLFSVATAQAPRATLTANSLLAARIAMTTKFKEALLSKKIEEDMRDGIQNAYWFDNFLQFLGLNMTSKDRSRDQDPVAEAVRDRVRAARTPAGKAYAYGDPEVCCVWDSASSTFKKIDVYGPFSTLCLNNDGTIAAIEFIGVCDRQGQKCQTKDAYYVSEVWRFEFAEGIFKYKDVRATIGGNNRHEFCDPGWSAIRTTIKAPADGWLKPFQHGRSFFAWLKEPHAAIEGPSGQSIVQFFSEGATEAMDQYQTHLDGVPELIKDSLALLQYDLRDDETRSREELAYYTLVSSFMLSMKRLA